MDMTKAELVRKNVRLQSEVNELKARLKTKAELVRKNVRLQSEVNELKARLKKRGLLRRLLAWVF